MRNVQNACATRREQLESLETLGAVLTSSFRSRNLRSPAASGDMRLLLVSHLLFALTESLLMSPHLTFVRDTVPVFRS